MVSRVVITPINDLAKTLARVPTSFLVSILGPSDQLDFPRTTCENILKLSFDDVGISTGRGNAPSIKDIESLIAFTRLWGGKGNIVFHCKAGTSRSPAASMIAAAAIDRFDLVEKFAKARPYFRPNRTMLRLADEILLGTGKNKHSLVSLEMSTIRLDNPTDVSACIVRF